MLSESWRQLGKMLQLSDAQLESLAHPGLRSCPTFIPESSKYSSLCTTMSCRIYGMQLNWQPAVSLGSVLFSNHIPFLTPSWYKHTNANHPGTKLTSITWCKNTKIILPSPSIGLFRILSTSCLVLCCSQFPSPSTSTSKSIFPQICFFLVPSWISAGAFQNVAQHLPCCVSQAILLCFCNKGAQKHGEKHPALCWMLCRCIEKMHRHSWLSIHTADPPQQQ